MQQSTIAVTAGRPDAVGQPLNHPIVLASNVRGEAGEYARTHGTATWEGLEAAVGALEGGTATSFATGMAAAAAALFALRPRVLVLPTYSYLGVRALVNDLVEQARLHVRFVDVTDTDGGRRGMRRRRRRVDRDAHQPHARCRRPTDHRPRSTARRRALGGRQHVRHAHLCPSAGRRRDGRGAQRHEVHRWSQRSDDRLDRHVGRGRARPHPPRRVWSPVRLRAHSSRSWLCAGCERCHCAWSVPRPARPSWCSGCASTRPSPRCGTPASRRWWPSSSGAVPMQPIRSADVCSCWCRRPAWAASRPRWNGARSTRATRTSTPV